MAKKENQISHEEQRIQDKAVIEKNCSDDNYAYFFSRTMSSFV